ncbi:hypothetical protein DIZ27_10600 [Streptomyces sp. NWU339]|nr:hypothetical protein DIZ27_10600 [Streptomyces sp. NWU339]
MQCKGQGAQPVGQSPGGGRVPCLTSQFLEDLACEFEFQDLKSVEACDSVAPGSLVAVARGDEDAT